MILAAIPAYNEEIALGSVILRTKKYVDNVIVIDDGSTDATSIVAQMAGAVVIHHDRSQGKGAALKDAFQNARQLDADILVCLDADGLHNPDEIPRLISPIQKGQADMVIGSRFLDKNGSFPVKQQIKQAMLPLPENTPHDIIPTDPLSGFIAFSRKGLESLDFPFEKTRFHQDLIAHFISKKIPIREVVISKRPSPTTKPGWDDSATVIAALPAHNEESPLAKIIPLIQQYVDLVIVADDGSTDATSAVARQMGAYVIRHPVNRGYGAALQTIFLTARELNADALVILDSDGQHNPADIEKVLKPLLNGADVVIGSRFLDSTKNNIPQYRKFGMKVLDTATAAAGVKKVTDSQSGFRAYGKKALSVISIRETGMSAGSEILIQISDNNLNVVEVPITVRYDIGNTSSMNPVSHGISVLGKIVTLISYRRPLLTFGVPGCVMIVAGMIAEIWVFAHLMETNTFHYILSLGSAVVLVLGMLLLIAGLILNELVVILERKAIS
jgi:glycosyltransferase involved in cell wall biosynthesis